MNVRRLLPWSAALLALLLAGGGAWHLLADRNAPTAPQTPRGGDFTLHGSKGPVALHDFRGKVVVLYFGYTFCPDVCPTSLAALREGLARLAPGERIRVKPLFVTVDPERDTLDKLDAYTAFFDPDLTGLTGTPEEIAQVAGQYGAAYRKHSRPENGDYVVDHSAFVYLVGPDGTLRAQVPHGATPDEMARALRAALNP